MKRAVRDLRDLVPLRPLTQAEAMRVAELQASRLLSLAELNGPPFPEEVITELFRTQVVRMSDIPVSGSAHWSKGRWVIALNGSESLARQRFSLAHEFKHVLDNPFIGYLYPKQQAWTPADRAGAHLRLLRRLPADAEGLRSPELDWKACKTSGRSHAGSMSRSRR